MTAAQQQQAAKNFAAYWKGKGYEKGESQPFWLSLLRDVYGVEHPEQFIQFEEQVHLDHTSFIDGTIPATHVLIEQKGLGKDLNKPIKQSMLDLGRTEALVVPYQAVLRLIGSNDRYVFVDDGGVAKRVFVEIGERHDQTIEISSDSLKVGDPIVTTGQAKLVDGVKLNVVK